MSLNVPVAEKDSVLWCAAEARSSKPLVQRSMLYTTRVTLRYVNGLPYHHVTLEIFEVFQP